MRPDPAFTRREQRWGVVAAMLCWTVSVTLMVLLVAWAMIPE